MRLRLGRLRSGRTKRKSGSEKSRRGTKMFLISLWQINYFVRYPGASSISAGARAGTLPQAVFNVSAESVTAEGSHKSLELPVFILTMAEREAGGIKRLKIAKAALWLLLSAPRPLRATQSSSLSWQGGCWSLSQEAWAEGQEGAGRSSIRESRRQWNIQSYLWGCLGSATSL